jgi:farnesyl diphosphate synthase
VTELATALADAAKTVERVLEEAMPHSDDLEGRLFDAMRYSTFAGGKRLRPFLVRESARLFNVPDAYAIRAGAAVELIHTYSLVHDDLPAMDNSDLRRGKPTAHKKFDEATAIIAGDALLTLAFEVLADSRTHPDAAVRCSLISSLAVAAGAIGMCGGQIYDLQAEDRTLDLESIKKLQNMKTGALFAYSCEAGALLAKADDKARQALRSYAHDLGIAFQIADDILDAEGDEAQVGKSIRRDAEAGKETFVSLLGLDKAKAEAAQLARSAANHLDLFGDKAKLLQSAAFFVVERQT